ncbi:MAG: hypothetical protein MUE37_02405 [Bacteroidales bacterium]|jgi:hypothetical protein|nr:hypothetical protein [Bacteroidales bacterium]
MKTRKFLTRLSIVVLIISVATPDSGAQSLYAGYRDRSDELPGMISDGEMLLIAGGAVVVIGGIVTYLIIKKKQDKKLEAAIPDFTKFSESVYINSKPDRVGSLESLCDEINRTTREAEVLFYSRLEKIPSGNHNSTGVVSLGVRINF